MSECCCGCGKDASKSNHYCVHTNKRVMAWCCDIDKQPKQWKNIANKTISIVAEEGAGSRMVCNNCIRNV